MESLEQRFEEALPVISMLQDKCTTEDHQIKALLCQLDDMEDLPARSNWC